jgi:hypothetical protein
MDELSLTTLLQRTMVGSGHVSFAAVITKEGSIRAATIQDKFSEKDGRNVVAMFQGEFLCVCVCVCVCVCL